jgi:hypothetical protein
VSCFKPFQITFRRAKDAIMSKSNHMDWKQENRNWMGRIGLRTITHKKISSLNLRSQVYALST